MLIYVVFVYLNKHERYFNIWKNKKLVRIVSLGKNFDVTGKLTILCETFCPPDSWVSGNYFNVLTLKYVIYMLAKNLAHAWPAEALNSLHLTAKFTQTADQPNLTSPLSVRILVPSVRLAWVFFQKENF